MEIRLAKKDDRPALNEIWRLSFGEESGFVALYFESRNWIEETAVVQVDGKVVSMLTMIPVSLTGENEEQCKASMLFAIATHPEYQRRGYADQLIEFSNRYLQTKQTVVTLLVPANQGLFGYYEKCGYAEGFSVREALLSADEIKMLAAKQHDFNTEARDAPVCNVHSAEPAAYNKVRRALLNGTGYLDYRNAELAFQKSLGQISDADLLIVSIGGSEGCAYYERITMDEVILKELLIPDRHIAAALGCIAEKVPAREYIVRTPSWAGAPLGGSVRPFGMIRINAPNVRPEVCHARTEGADFYLGIAYD